MAQGADHTWAQQTTYVSSSQLNSKRVAADFVPDGNVDKSVWHHANWTKVDRDAFKPVTFPEAATDVASLWTPDYVYFAFRCKYTALNLYDSKDTSKDFWHLWDRDVVEIFLNPQPEHMRHYYEFEVAPNNLWIDFEINMTKGFSGNEKWESGFQHATVVDEKKHIWTSEWRIPVAVLSGGKPLEAGIEWRINFFRCDGFGGDNERRFLSWSVVHNDNNSFHAPWSFGVIRFVK